ncbi:WD40 repeat-like protein [Piedraia hortae CBS 480.64]|uniref:Elongator complex protein 2 n=1 Tax=Piedraia hortae CBS 480.64 TaxID=1314780 RepID=A0A6A7BXC3_9PEZI|nr:WD40 repeat-like protein [Piedraia hortae CBS 480.64]
MQPIFISAGGNTHPSSASWRENLLAFGSGTNIALWNPSLHRGVYALLKGHTKAVNAVELSTIPSKGWITLFSGGADGEIRVWSQKPTEPTSEGARWECTHTLNRTASINALRALPAAGVLVTGSADRRVGVYGLDDYELIQDILLTPKYIPLAVAATVLGNGVVVLAVAGTGTLIQIFTRWGEGGFELKASLKGHEGWIRGLDFYTNGNETLLASGSQDKFIRLWRFKYGERVDGLENKAYELGDGYEVALEALLVGHEDWVYTVKWMDGASEPTLLSASADNSLAVWQADSASGVWVSKTRLGEISVQKGSTTATGSTGGFAIGLWMPDGGSVVSLGRTGSWRKWDFDEESKRWMQAVGVSGHVKEVQDLAWATDGSYLLTTSFDQTTRLFAEWERTSSWHEFARPQIHGYDLICIDALKGHRFVSGAEEKLLRVFNEPRSINALLGRLCGSEAKKELPDAASVPVLGLSNKTVAAEDENGVDPFTETQKVIAELDHPPLEDHLARFTLWPEQEKLYGHGYQISAVAASHDGSLVATACGASTSEHAVVRIYETTGWTEVKPPLAAHSLTITSLAFSQDDQHLLSVGRDRQWAVFKRESPTEYKLLTRNLKGHSRMILDCSWAPKSLGNAFVTAGRNKEVNFWRLDGDKCEMASSLPTPAPVSAIAFRQETDTNGEAFVALGMDTGDVQLVAVDGRLEVKAQISFAASECPSAAITGLRWRPGTSHLAVASDDHSLRIYDTDAANHWS